MKTLKAGPLTTAIVRPVPDTYDRCIRKNNEPIDVPLAREQHAKYCQALQKLGLKLIWTKMDNTLPDSCFIEDTAVVFGQKAVICNMRARSRMNEVSEVAKVMKELKETYRIKPPATIDGGDVLTVENRVFVGITSRTNLHAVKQLKQILKNSKTNVIPVKVRNVLHLKSACTYLGNGIVVFAKGCFDTRVLQDLGEIIVPKGEEYAADCVAVNGSVLMARGYAKTKKLVEKEGFQVCELDVSEFRKGDGALTCLSILL